MATSDNYWDNEVILQDIKVSTHSTIRVSVCTKDGKEYVNIHEWYNTNKDETLRPGKHGICIRRDTNADVIPDLIEVLKESLQVGV